VGVESNCIQWIIDKSIGRRAKSQCGKPSEMTRHRNLDPNDFPLTNSRLVGVCVVGSICGAIVGDDCGSAGDLTFENPPGAIGTSWIGTILKAALKSFLVIKWRASSRVLPLSSSFLHMLYWQFLQRH
jgi:hypothetical protein